MSLIEILPHTSFCKSARTEIKRTAKFVTSTHSWPEVCQLSLNHLHSGSFMLSTPHFRPVLTPNNSEGHFPDLDSIAVLVVPATVSSVPLKCLQTGIGFQNQVSNAVAHSRPEPPPPAPAPLTLMCHTLKSHFWGRGELGVRI